MSIRISARTGVADTRGRELSRGDSRETITLMAGLRGLSRKRKIQYERSGQASSQQADVRPLDLQGDVPLKRVGNLWDSIVSKENIEAAYLSARKGKTWQRTIQRFDEHLEENLESVRVSLVDKTFRTAPYRSKKVFEPKERDIFILPFAPDRIVQHALMRVIEPIWESLFIHDSYACRKGKGMHKGSTRTMEFVRRNEYCLKCDISKFYPSVRHDVLQSVVRRKIKCPETLRLIDDIINSFPGETNIPIGNYTSQWFGNLYLNELDTFVKHELRCRDYLRYCDDFCLFSDDKGYLNECAARIREFLCVHLALRMSKCDLFPVARGVDFLGYRHFKDFVLLRKSTTRRIKQRLKALPWKIRSKILTKERGLSSIASTLGWIQWGNTFHLRQSLHLDEWFHDLKEVS